MWAVRLSRNSGYKRWHGRRHVGREVDGATWQRRRAAGCHWLLPGCRRSPAPGPSTPQACTAATEVPGRGSSAGRFPEPPGGPSPAGWCWARGAPAFSRRACAWHAPGFLPPCRRCSDSLRQIVVLRRRLSRPVVMGCTRDLAGTTAPATRVQTDGSGGRTGHRRPGWAGAPAYMVSFQRYKKARCSPRSYSTTTSRKSFYEYT